MARGLPSMTALLGLLAIAGYQNRDKIAEMLKNAGAGSGGKGMDGLGGLLSGLGGAGAGGLLNGGLGELMDRFKNGGQGDVADSWMKQGPNKEISADQLKKSIGPDVLDALEKQTGLSEKELLSRLARELPNAVDKYTPDGRLPSAS